MQTSKSKEKMLGLLASQPIAILMLLAALPFALSAVAVLGYQDLQVISTPGNPASGYLRFYATTGALNCLTSSGGNCLSGIGSPLTTKGDLYTYGTGNARLGVGTNGQVLYANSGATNGIDWEAPISLTTTGTSGAATYTPGNPNVLNIPQYSGGGSGAMTQIAQTILGSAQATVTFSSISGSYTQLMLTVMGRSSTSADNDGALIQFNGDTGNDYDYQDLVALNGSSSSSGSSSQSSIAAISLTAASAPSGTVGSFTVMIPSYSGTTFYKTGSSFGGTTTSAITANYIQSFWFDWHSTSAITSIKLFLSSGANFTAGSAFTLYGVQ